MPLPADANSHITLAPFTKSFSPFSSSLVALEEPHPWHTTLTLDIGRQQEVMP
jgi:hypothetical protein